MTICIASICDDGKKVIVASDRMITVGGLSQEFEHGTPKMHQISSTCLAVSAGDALIPVELFNSVKRSLSQKANPSVFETIEAVKMGFLEIRKKVIEEMYLKPRGLDIKSFYGGGIQNLPPQLAIPIDNKIQEHEIEVAAIIAGIDSDGGHIFHIIDPGTAHCFNSMGFCAIGSGELHALSAFIANDFNPTISFKKALYITFEAKKRAEKAPGVGEKTDMWIISDGGTKKISPEVLKLLNEAYSKKLEIEKTRTPELDELIESIEIEGL